MKNLTNVVIASSTVFEDINSALLDVIGDIRPVTTTIAALSIAGLAVWAMFSKNASAQVKEDIIKILLLVLVISGALALAGWAAATGDSNF